ncbi:MAG: FMN phosphatase YigB (HAD superfamily) [Candidatus Paceibacteria bacterium]|jgi:FMN phosphatase YigB (HAD superfamily)
MSDPAWKYPNPRGLLVDLDGTLYSAKPLKLVMGLELLLTGLPKLQKIRAFRKEHEALRESAEDCAGDPFARQLQNAAQKLGCSCAELESVVRHWMVDRPCRWLRFFRNTELLEELANFRLAGGRCALVSDYPARKKLVALNALQLFDEVLANGEPGGPTHLKPNPAGYLEAARRLGVLASECLVIGDRPDADGLAAERAGMAYRKV